MMELPAEHELIALFESEPELTDPQYPWAYNTVTFNLTREDDHLSAVIEPGLERVRLTWSRAEEELLDVVLEGIARLSTETRDGRETLLLTFLDDLPFDELRVRVKPTIHFFWRTRGKIL
ncbi:MAG: hypothetical protein H0U04_03655 [Rubrobacter sp.]|nr:hypothetical protein [Rubrobacter sp.]